MSGCHLERRISPKSRDDSVGRCTDGVERRITKLGSDLIGGLLFSKISETPIVHVPKLFPLLHWFQNTFCFLSSSTPSHVGKFF